MNKSVMCKFTFTLTAVLILAACTDLLGPVGGTTADRPPKGMGYVSVFLDYNAPRTLMPSIPAFTRYVLQFNRASGIGSDVEADFNAGQTLGPVALEPGDWKVTVTAYQNIMVQGLQKEFAAAQGTGTVTVNAGQVSSPVSITLRPFEIPAAPAAGLNGVFAYNITVGGGVSASGELFLNSKNGSMSFPVSLNSFPATASIEVPAGEYDFSVVLTNSAGMKAGKYAAVHIYAGLETSTDGSEDISFDFTDADFAAVIPLAGTLSIREPAGVLTGAKNITISAYQDKDFAQFLASTIEYQWDNSADEWFIEIPAPVSAVYLETALRVNDGNGEVIYTYKYQEPVTGISDNGKFNVNLSLSLYGIAIGGTPNGAVLAEIAGQGRSAALSGDTVTLKISPSLNYHLDASSLKVNGGPPVSLAFSGGIYSFTMPAADVTISAAFLPDFVSVHGKISLQKPPALNLASGENTVVSAYRDQGRFEHIGTDAVLNWNGGEIEWVVPMIPSETTSAFLRVEVTDDSGKVYRFDPPAVNGIDSVAGKDAGQFAMSIYSVGGLSAAGGTVVPDIKFATAGQTVNLSVNPVAGYHLKPGTLAVTHSGGQAVPLALSGGVYSFTMPAADITVDAVFLASVSLSGNLSITKPAGVSLNLSDNVKVRAYSDPGRTTAIPGAEFVATWDDFSGSYTGNWSVSLPVNTPIVYLNVELYANDGLGSALYLMRHGAPVTGIAYADIPGINLAIVIHEIALPAPAHGSVKAYRAGQERSAAAAGDIIALEPNPAAGYHLKPGTLAVTQSGGLAVPLALNGGIYSFAMPAADVIVGAVFLPDNVPLSGTQAITKPATLGAASMTVAAYETVSRAVPLNSKLYTFNSDGWTAENDFDWSIDIPAGYTSAYLVFEFNSSYETAFPVSGIGETGKSGITGALAIYSVNGLSAAGGTVVPGTEFATAGQAVTLSVTPAAGYHLKPGTLAVTQSGGPTVPLALNGGIYRFTMPAADVTVGAVFLPDNVPLSGTQAITKPATLGAASMTVAAYETVSRAVPLNSKSYTFNSDGWTAENDFDWSIDIPAGYASAYLVFEFNGSYETALPVSGIGESGKSGITGTLAIYSVNGLSLAGGNITPSVGFAQPGDTVALAVQAAPGYEYVPWPLKIKINGSISPVTADGLNYTFTMPAGVDAAVMAVPGDSPFRSIDAGLTIFSTDSTAGDTLVLGILASDSYTISGYTSGDIVLSAVTVPLASDLHIDTEISGGAVTVEPDTGHGITVTVTPDLPPSAATLKITVTAQNGVQKVYNFVVE